MPCQDPDTDCAVPEMQVDKKRLLLFVLYKVNRFIRKIVSDQTPSRSSCHLCRDHALRFAVTYGCNSREVKTCNGQSQSHLPDGGSDLTHSFPACRFMACVFHHLANCQMLDRIKLWNTPEIVLVCWAKSRGYRPVEVLLVTANRPERLRTVVRRTPSCASLSMCGVLVSGHP